MLWLCRFIRGFLSVVFYGEFSEKILNLCVQNRITLWNSRLVKRGIESFISLSDFRKLRPIIRGSKIRVHILKKSGIPFIISRYKNRIGILTGVISFFLFLEIMSGFVWVVDVTGNKSVKKEEIVKSCEEIGIYIGVPTDEINAKTKREELLLKCDSLAWASLNIEGCRLTVNVSEIRDTKIDASRPSNLVASVDGTIKKIDITSGNCLVKTGDTVKIGDMLVSGIIEKGEGTSFVSSSGTVTAITTRVLKFSQNYESEVAVENGKIKTKKVLELFGLRIPLYLGSETAYYNSSLKTENVKLFGKSIPIKLYNKRFVFVDKNNVTLSKDDVYKELEKQLKSAMEKENVKEFTVEERNYTETENGIELSVIVSAEENIAIGQEIIISK